MKTYTDIGNSFRVINFDFLYNIFDTDGANFNRADYFGDQNFFQLTPNTSSKLTIIGSILFTINTGDYFGFFVNSLDSALGRANIVVTGDFFPSSTIPEPGSWAMMIIGFGIMGMAYRRRRSVKVTYA